MTDPRIITIAATVFALLGLYNLYSGGRRMRDARRAGLASRWYKQLGLLTGIEYILLALVFLLIMVSRQGGISPGLSGLVGPLYFGLLILAAIFAGLVIRQGILNSRALRASRSIAANKVQAPPVVIENTRPLSKSGQEEQAQRQRERRKKAAAARRRRAGKA